jgi:histidinol phosphatase-like PHP family hydrolase
MAFMHRPIPRRSFLAGSAAAGALWVMPGTLSAAEDIQSPQAELDFPLIDFHVHLDNSTIDKALEIATQRGVKFGIVEHAGTKENQYPVVLSNDQELKGYLANLAGKPVYKGIQAEWLDWMGCFSRDALAQLDYVLSDAMTIRGKDGKRVKMWERGYETGEKQAFMDRYVDWHVEIMDTEPLDVFANLTWLPSNLVDEYDSLWTTARMEKVIAAALKYGVALEISSSMKIPKIQFLKLAKAAGIKFTFGSNGRYPNMGKLDYSVDMARALNLKKSDMFTPAPTGQKAVQRRKY